MPVEHTWLNTDKTTFETGEAVAKKSPLQTQLDRLSAISLTPREPESVQLLIKTLETAPGLALAKAADIICKAACGVSASDEHEPEEQIDDAWSAYFFPAMAGALARCCDDPDRQDKNAPGKTALATALDRMEYSDAAPFLAGAHYVQMEPVMGGSVDVAPPFRARCIAALVRLRHPERFDVMGELFWDACPDARIGAARAAAYDGSETARALLRARALAGDDDVVLGEVLSGLLSFRGLRDVEFVGRFLADSVVQAHAAIALGESRMSQALAELERAWEETGNREAWERIAFGVALHGTDEAMTMLEKWVQAGPDDKRIGIMSAVAEVFGEENPRYQRLLRNV